MQKLPASIHIHINTRSILLLLLIVAVIWLFSQASAILLVLVLAALLSVSITPAVSYLQRYIPRALAIVLIYLAMLGVGISAIGLLIPILTIEIGKLANNLPQIGSSVAGLLDRWVTPYVPGFKLVTTDLQQELGITVGGVVGQVGGVVVSIGTTIVALLVNLLLILVVGFFMTIDPHFARRLIMRMCPPEHRPLVSQVVHNVGLRLGRWVRGQALAALFYGVTFGLGMWIMGVPYALSLAVIGVILELVPYLGEIVITVLAVLVALSVSPALAVGVLLLELVIANILGHVVYPRVVGGMVGLHPMVIIIALFVGATLGGILGAFLSIPLAIVLKVLFDEFYRFEETEQLVEEVAPAAPPVEQSQPGAA